MKMQHLYLVFCILGTILPLAHFVPWVIENGLDISLFIQQLFSTGISAFFAWDVIVSALVLLFFIYSEGRRLLMTNLWLPVIATLCVGVSLGLPLFLYLRQLQLEGTS